MGNDAVTLHRRVPRSLWTGLGHDPLWADPANWSAGTPGHGTVAVFRRPVALVDLAGTSDAAGTFDLGQLAVTGGSVQLTGGVLRWEAPPFEKSLSSLVGLRVDGGLLTIAADAALQGAHTVALGAAAPASLHVQGVLTDEQVYAGLAAAASITVEGPAARWETTGRGDSLQLGSVGTATLLVRAGATVRPGTIRRQVAPSRSVVCARPPR